MKKILNIIENIIFPSTCLICKNFFQAEKKVLITKDLLFLNEEDLVSALFGHFICPDCLNDFPIIKTPNCPRCGIPFLNPNIKEHLCSNCVKTKSKISTLRAFFIYDTNAKKSIQLFKYHHKTILSKPLSFLLFYLFIKNFQLYQNVHLVYPIPIHYKKERLRGFNQSFQFLRYWQEFQSFTNHYNLSQDKNNFVKIKQNKPQVHCTIAQRKENVKGVFKLLNPEKVKKKNILLIDDVYTSGATAEEASKVFFQAGASQVHFMSLTRTIYI